MSRAAYEIRAEGTLLPSMLDDFDGIAVDSNPSGLTIRADLADEAELHGLLDALRRGGLVLVEIRREQLHGPRDSGGSSEGSPEDPSAGS
ncbi:hypothetical protein [Aeromicrobium sp.]|uniref:hypothetical protein n=1 Tax=Aeromicrobium sp. TaxID=1871063 RepID=UPI003D6A07CF